MVEAERRVALLEQTRAKAVKLLAADIKEVRRLDGTTNVALVCSLAIVSGEALLLPLQKLCLG